jgi:hypothetical protein
MAPISDKTELDVIFMTETDLAVLVYYDGIEYWIPDSQIHEDSECFVGCQLDRGESCTLVCSEWILKQKGIM